MEDRLQKDKIRQESIILHNKHYHGLPIFFGSEFHTISGELLYTIPSSNDTVLQVTNNNDNNNNNNNFNNNNDDNNNNSN